MGVKLISGVAFLEYNLIHSFISVPPCPFLDAIYMTQLLLLLPILWCGTDSR